MKKLLYIPVLLLLLWTQGVSAQVKPQRSASYIPFEIISTKLNATMSSEYVEAVLMCKSTSSNLAANLELLKNYDIISTSGDHSLAITRFGGRQQGRSVVVDVMVSRPDQVFRYVAVNNEFVLSCGY